MKGAVNWAMGREITFLKCKYDGSVKRERTGELLDTVGDWLVIAHVPGRHRHLKFGEEYHGGYGAELFYLNTRLPLTTAVMFENGAVCGQYVDAALPATFDGAVARYVDLDLDISADVGAEAFVKDILDFEQRRIEMAYPPEVVAAAWEGIRIGSELLGRGLFPFDGSAPDLLGRLAGPQAGRDA
jgi:protein associated with RNAse G/E